MVSNEDSSFETLLLLNGEIFPMDNGYWTKFEAFRVEPNKYIPHGIKYSLTLHDRNNTRILGFDNAHAIKTKRRKFGSQKIMWDHIHQAEKVFAYEYKSAGQLLEDFWKGVKKII